MLSDDDNRLLCLTGSGTPRGVLFRRFWLPALLAAELPGPDCAPRRLRVLGEDLVAFRDSAGTVGVVSAYCPHKLAPLYFGRNEAGGLRCVYHGWKFDVAGRCVEIPNLPPNFNVAALRERAAITAYPTREAGGLVWVYLGPRDGGLPELPAFEWTRLDPAHTHVARWLQRTNWAQGMEGEIDSSHISFLHRDLTTPTGSVVRPVQVTAAIPPGTRDGAPLMAIRETPYGFLYGARRNNASGRFLWRVTQWFVPMYSMIPQFEYPRSGRAWVPVDDHHVMVFNYTYRGDRPFTQAERDYLDSGPSFPSPHEAAAFELPDGYVIDTFVPLARRDNDYGLDRQRQKAVNFSGIAVITDQDRALQENLPSAFGLGPGRLVDRSREMLVPSDAPVITARRILLRLARALQQGIEPSAPREGSLYAAMSMSALAAEGDFDDFLRAQGFGQPTRPAD